MDIHACWRAVLDQDAEAMRSFLHPSAVIRWHCTNECFSAEEFIRTNCEYPGSWDGQIERTETMGDLIITAVRVFPKDASASFHCVSFMRLHEGKIIALDEYWSDDGPPPQWRQNMHIGTKIRE